MKKAELLSTLNEFLVEQYANGRRVLLIVDEAQNLSNKVLEEIRLLSGVETTKEKVLRIILAGQPELNDKLNSPGLVQLAQRIRLRFHLTPLSKTDTSAYIQHRLEVAGSQGRQIFAASLQAPSRSTTRAFTASQSSGLPPRMVSITTGPPGETAWPSSAAALSRSRFAL